MCLLSCNSFKFTPTIVAEESLGLLLVALGTNEAANDEVSNGSQQNDKQTDLCLQIDENFVKIDKLRN